MADKQISIIIKAVDDATKTIKTVGWDLSALAKNNQDNFAKMAWIWTASFWAIAFSAKKAVDAYAEVERANRQLENAVIGVSKGTKEQVAEIQNLTGALQKKAWIDSDSLNMWVAQLSTFWLQTKSVMALTKSLADLTVNQNWVNATSDQYIQSANIMAKAINWQFWALEKMWIRFTEAQQKMIEHWTEAQKVSAIQEWLAQNLRETTDTVNWVDLAMAQSSRTMEDMTESIWQSLAPAFNTLLQSITPVVQKVTDWILANPELTSKIIMVAWAVAWLVAVVWTLWLAIPSIITWITALWTALMFLVANPIWLTITAIWALIVAWTQLYEHRDDLKRASWELWYSIEAHRRNIKTWVILNITILKDTVSKIWNSMLDWMKSTVTSVFDWITSRFDAIVNTVTSAVWKLQSLRSSVAWWGWVSWKRALWWPVQSWRSYLVWENWPEMFTPSSSWKIIPNNQLWWWVNISINMGWVVVQKEADEQRLANTISEMLNRQIQLFNLWIN